MKLNASFQTVLYLRKIILQKKPSITLENIKANYNEEVYIFIVIPECSSKKKKLYIWKK